MRLAALVLLLAACGPSDNPELPLVEIDDDPPWERPDGPSVGEAALEWVDPFIGTGGLGFQYAGMTPAVQVPLGLVKLGPDTTNNGSHPSAFHHFSGYWWNDPHIRGFSHLHFVGTGTTDYGNLRVNVGTAAQLDRLPHKWRAGKVEGSEVAAPGYYAVELDNGARAELTATLQAGVHRYHVPAGGMLTFDAASAVDDEGVEDARLAVTSGGKIEGWVKYRGSYVGRDRPFTLWFTARATAPDEAFVWTADGIDESATSATGTVAGAILRYHEPTTVDLVVGVSLIDADHAARHAEVGPFEEVRADNERQWAELLGRIDFGELPDDERTLNYTALYNCFRMPTRFDEDGLYRGLDGELHDVDHRYFTDLSLWDTYRTLHPLWTLIYPELQRDVLRSLLLMNRDGGYIPRWPAAISYTGGMEGDPAAMLFAEGALARIDGVDYETAFEALLETARAPTPAGAPYGGRGGIADYVALGYVPADRDGAAASNSLEYPVADNALANLAEHLGRPEEAEFRDRAVWYRNGWDSETKFFRPRNADGTWVEPFSFTAYNDRSGYFAEGSAWNYRFHVLHDPEGLMELFGGPDELGDAIEEFMAESRLWTTNTNKLVAPDPYYWHGNEPPLHTPFFLGAADRWDRLTHWVGEVRRYAYTTGPDGLAGNDDGGTLSAWYVLSSLGVYPIVGTDRWIGFDRFAPEAAVEGVTLPVSRQFVRTRDMVRRGP